MLSGVIIHFISFVDFIYDFFFPIQETIPKANSCEFSLFNREQIIHRQQNK